MAIFLISKLPSPQLSHLSRLLLTTRSTFTGGTNKCLFKPKYKNGSNLFQSKSALQLLALILCHLTSSTLHF